MRNHLYVLRLRRAQLLASAILLNHIGPDGDRTRNLRRDRAAL